MADEKKYSFIEEGNASKRHKQFIKRIKMFGATALLAVVFGVVAGLVFCIFCHNFAEWFEWNEDKDFYFQSSSPEMERSDSHVQDQPGSLHLPNVSEEANTLDKAVFGNEPGYADWTEWINENNRFVVMVQDIVKEVDLFQKPLERKEVISGLIVAEKNEKLYILSSGKEIKDDHKLKVAFYYGFKADAEIHAWDKETDLLLLSVDKKKIPKDAWDKYKVANLEFSQEINTGAPIVALGSPNGTMFSMDYGIVTGEAMDVNVMDGNLKMFYTNLCHTPEGEGFVVNLQGGVLGVIMERFNDLSGQGIKSFIGIRELKVRIEQMINKKERVYAGIIGNDLLGEYAEKNEFGNGVYVSEVIADSPAYHAGLTMGDVIVKVNDVYIKSMVQFYETVSDYPDGEEIIIKIRRKIDDKWRRREVSLRLDKLD